MEADDSETQFPSCLTVAQVRMVSLVCGVLRTLCMEDIGFIRCISSLFAAEVYMKSSAAFFKWTPLQRGRCKKKCIISFFVHQ